MAIKKKRVELTSLPDCAAKPKSLLGNLYPPGFEDEGKRLVKECEEFKAYELLEPKGMMIVERSAAIEESLFACFFRINEDRQNGKRSNKSERMAWAITMLRLANFTKSGDGFSKDEYGKAPPLFGIEGRGGTSVACRIAHTIGNSVLSLHDASPDQLDGAIEDCAALFKNALRAYVTYSGLRPDGRIEGIGSNPPREAQLVLEGERIFLETLSRPTKPAIRKALESKGFRFKGKDQAGKWRDVFNKAGLGNLPDSPIS